MADLNLGLPGPQLMQSPVQMQYVSAIVLPQQQLGLSARACESTAQQLQSNMSDQNYVLVPLQALLPDGTSGAGLGVSPVTPFPFQQTQMGSFPNKTTGNAALGAVNTNRSFLQIGVLMDDDDVLLEALRKCEGPENYVDAFKELHCKNNHSTEQWQNYFISNCQRFMEILQRDKGKPQEKARPTPGSSTTTHSSSGGVESQKARMAPGKGWHPFLGSTPQAVRTVKTARKPNFPEPFPDIHKPVPRSNGKFRRTEEDLRVVRRPWPELPTRPPSPPPPASLVVLPNNKHMFTEEDYVYFAKALLYYGHLHPEWTQTRLCKQLRDGAPHHSESSWKNYWTGKHDFRDEVDRVLARVRTRVVPKDRSGFNDGRVPPSTDSRAAESLHIAPRTHRQSPPDSVKERQKRHERHQRQREKDIRRVAKHIATTPDWDRLSDAEMWQAFGNEGGSREQWPAFYESYKKAINELARDYT